MLLSYVDESGINYSQQAGLFKDGPFLVWVAILIPEAKYFHLERLFCDLANEKLGAADWQNIEMHGTNIWLGEAPFDKIDLKDRKDYFNELFQLFAKLDIKVVVSIKKKEPRATKEAKKKNDSLARRTLLTGLEHELSRLNQTSIVIADDSDGELEKDVYKRVQWRHNPRSTFKADEDFRFKYETQSCFILDSVHFVDSKKALFVQIADQAAYVIQRCLTYAWMVNHPSSAPADLSKVPVDPSTFFFFALRCIKLYHYSHREKDSSFLQDGLDPYQFFSPLTLNSIE